MRPTSLGSIGRYGASHGSSPTGDARLGGLALEVLEALLDGVLVGAGERRVDEVAGVGVARVDRQLGAVLDGAADLVDVGEVDHRVDALAEQVHAERDEVDVAGPLAVPEQAALDAVGAGHHRQLGCRDRGTAVVVRVQADTVCSRRVSCRENHSIWSA